ncbi:schlafen-like protein 1 [Ornithorhynchus anatinus]|uniref:schlafen-like protein 1 n=1 Tax=Ornithorhynchus anatinus TaxID=9258 RepID=UPI0019D4C2BD|nr:schlafen-like protein 1 [Ornithorhynchus anatinus]
MEGAAGRGRGRGGEETGGPPAQESRPSPEPPTRPCTLFVGNLNPQFPRTVLAGALQVGLEEPRPERVDVEVVRRSRLAYAMVRVRLPPGETPAALAKQLQAAAEERPILQELAERGKVLVVSESWRGVHEPQGGRGLGRARPEGSVPLPTVRGPAAEVGGAGPRPPGPLAGTRSDSAIVRQEIVGQERLFLGSNLGCETRNVEFKRGGGGYLGRTLKHHVRRYACAFLNGEGGSLLVGVEDGGRVQGVSCGPRDEDRVRLLVDAVLKGFRPQVFPDAYALHFIPVVQPGAPGPTGAPLKVIRLSVHTPRPQTEPLLYETDLGEVYLRREGSVQGPLTGSAIQEWCRQRWTAELDKLQGRLRALAAEKEDLQQQSQQPQSQQPQSQQPQSQQSQSQQSQSQQSQSQQSRQQRRPCSHFCCVL